MKENDSNSAVLHFNKALATDPKCVDALVARGALSANQGHYKRAMQDFESALQIDHLSIYLYIYRRMFVCLSVLYVLGPCNSWRHQTFHGTPIDPEEG